MKTGTVSTGKIEKEPRKLRNVHLDILSMTGSNQNVGTEVGKVAVLEPKCDEILVKKKEVVHT